MIDCSYYLIKIENILLLLKYLFFFPENILLLLKYLFFFPESDCNSYNLLIIRV